MSEFKPLDGQKTLTFKEAVDVGRALLRWPIKFHEFIEFKDIEGVRHYRIGPEVKEEVKNGK